MHAPLPKVLHPLLGKPLAYWPLALAEKLGAAPLVAVVGHQRERVEENLRAVLDKAPLHFAVQKAQRGTADAVLAAKGVLAEFKGDILLMAGDTALLEEGSLGRLLALHRKEGALLSFLTSMLDNPHGYGRIWRQDGRAVAVIEEKNATEAQRALREVNVGCYVVQSAFLWKALEALSPNPLTGEFYLTDIVAAAARGGGEGGIETLCIPEAEAMGVNDKVQLAQATDGMRRRILHRHMLAGVTLLCPQSTWIEAGVEIGQGCTLGPQVFIGGNSRLEEAIKIDQGSHITDCHIGAGTHLKPYCVLEGAVVGPGCMLGPFARLRPGTRLEEAVHIGNFVETKNAVLSKGAKANHLSYLGDVDIGEATNVGAGTITCNYDGFAKHRSRIGKGAFIGSDVQLVSPVCIGDNAWVAAGATVTQDVPEGALAISRIPQQNKLDYAGRLKEKKRKPKP
ncbi:MAG: bifunctional UDP-N-acetylglucosamine diphosphorylase/glucosamine-1-phosphate N-acetyltransferase GlmU [Cystobacterineae bacterium]|nr:bifunctional UDP-N-acetylglucosamine diphosphorylase/glucosamine-1-phosphate N-acetyltransferase GlmU [Cystobacterineae bacterium]